MRIGKSSLRTGAAIATFLASVGPAIGCGSSHSGGTGGNAGSGNGGSGAGDAVAGGGTGSGGAGTGGIGSGGTGLGGRGGIAGATGGGGSGGTGGSGTGGASGGVAIGPGCVARTPGQWQITSTVNEPPPLPSYTGKILWSGKALFVIGYNTTGGKYDPCLDTWQPFPAHSFSSLILATDQGAYFWTASVGSTPLRFSFFDFATPAWRELAIDGYPTAADDPDAGGTAALVGGKLVRWGGKSQYATPYPLLTNTGAVYDPVTDRWQAMSTAGAPAERVVKGNSVAAAGRLFVWGGARTLPGTSGIPKDDPTAAAMTKAPGLVCPSWNPFECSYGDGALYDPATDSWKPVSQAGAPNARYGHFTAWTGTRVLVWGGAHYFASPSGGTSFEGLLDGALYDPATDSWTPMAPSPLPSPYLSLYPRWSEGLLRLEPWATPEDPKYTYDPVTDRWAVPGPGPTVPARPDGPTQPTIVWTGSYWIAFGGYRLGTTPPNPCLDLPPLTTGCDPPGPEHISVSEAAVALPALPAP